MLRVMGRRPGPVLKEGWETDVAVHAGWPGILSATISTKTRATWMQRRLSSSDHAITPLTCFRTGNKTISHKAMTDGFTR